MTKEIKIIDYENDRVECSLCHRWMSIKEYDIHYDRCLDIVYLLSVAKQKGECYTREDLENCKPMIIDKLLEKYLPKEVAIESLKDRFKY